MPWWYKIVSLVLIVNLIGLGLVYYEVARLKNQIPYSALQALVKSETEIVAKLNGLQNQLAQAQSLTLSSEVLGMADLLPDVSNSSVSASNHFISISDKSAEAVNVYKEQADFSAIIGQLVPDYTYPYYTKLDDWYLVNFKDAKTGWVKASLVREEAP